MINLAYYQGLAERLANSPDQSERTLARLMLDLLEHIKRQDDTIAKLATEVTDVRESLKRERSY